MAKLPELRTARDAIAWSYANLGCAHAAVAAGRIKHIQTDWMIRAKLFRGMRDGTMGMRSLYDDERLKLTESISCAYCGDATSISIDHLIPRAVGGGDENHNLVRACRPCNSSKGKRDMLVWLADRNRFPPLLLLRRYLKIAFGMCEKADLLDCELTDPRLSQLPFDLGRLPREFPPLEELRL